MPSAPPRHSPYADPPGPPAAALPAPLRRRLDTVRTRALAVAWTGGVAVIVATLVALAALQMLGDWWLDLPRVVRAILLAADLGVVGWLARRRLLAPWRRRLTTATAALRAEKTFPDLRGRLIAAVQLSQGPDDGPPVSPQLRDAVVAQAAAAAARLDFRAVTPAGPATRLALGALAFTAAAACIVFLDIGRSAPLLRRLALSAEPLPTRTIVVPVTRDLLPALGAGIELAARATGELPRTGRVRVTHADGKTEDFPVAADTAEPDLFKLPLPAVRLALTYRFHLGDGRGPEFTVTPLTPPALAKIEATEVFPDYTGLGAIARTPASLTLLAGSRLQLRIASTLPLKSATIRPQGGAEPVPMTLGGPTGATGELAIPEQGLTGFSIALVSAEGAPSVADTVYRVQVTRDRAPAIQLLQPAAERDTITLRATPVVEFEAADDFALTDVAFCYQVAPPVLLNTVETTTDTVRVPFPIEGAPGRQHRTHPWKLAALQPPPPEGSVITYWIEAADNNTATGPGLTRTRRQQFVIVSPAAKREEILRRIGENSNVLKDLSDTQRKLGEEIDSLLPTPAAP